MFSSCHIQGLHHQPSALVVFNVGSNFTSDIGVAKAVDEVVLNLKVFAHLQQNGLGLIVQGVVLEASLEEEEEEEVRR